MFENYLAKMYVYPVELEIKDMTDSNPSILFTKFYYCRLEGMFSSEIINNERKRRRSDLFLFPLSCYVVVCTGV